MSLIERTILKLRFHVWSKLKANFCPSFYFSHSQFGEDMVVRFLTNDSTLGFYVDIGAHHPVYISNTYHFYSKGWRGINIDAIPGSMDVFKVLRPKDINLELCLSPLEGEEIDFFIFDRPAFNTFCSQRVDEVVASG
ncbi:hypothetical protein [Nostoc sp.]|uniref:hypothetical protein n=1 Tax=Nostoc sp. TaxID=1180 RepID=UPI0035937AD7